MPIYDYHCAECGNFEKTQKITEEALRHCPDCGQEVKRIISKNVGVLFKGSGFYSTDSKKLKAEAKKLNQERQKDNQAILDGDVSSYVKQAEETSKKVAEA